MREREKAARAKRVRPLVHLIYEVQREYGADWYYSPGRWPTSDGIVPWGEFLQASRAVWPFRAIERLNLARGIALAFAGDTPDGHRIRTADLKEAFPNG